MLGLALGLEPGKALGEDVGAKQVGTLAGQSQSCIPSLKTMPVA